MKTIINVIRLVRNLSVDLINWKVLKSKGYTIGSVLEVEISKFKSRQSN